MFGGWLDLRVMFSFSCRDFVLCFSEGSRANISGFQVRDLPVLWQHTTRPCVGLFPSVFPWGKIQALEHTLEGQACSSGRPRLHLAGRPAAQTKPWRPLGPWVPNAPLWDVQRGFRSVIYGYHASIWGFWKRLRTHALPAPRPPPPPLWGCVFVLSRGRDVSNWFHSWNLQSDCELREVPRSSLHTHFSGCARELRSHCCTSSYALQAVPTSASWESMWKESIWTKIRNIVSMAMKGRASGLLTARKTLCKEISDLFWVKRAVLTSVSLTAFKIT